MKTRIISLFLAVLMLFSLAACGTNGGSSSTGSDLPSSQPAGSSPDASTPADPSSDVSYPDDSATSDTYIFTDDAGRQVEVPYVINSIAPSGSMAQIVLMAIAPDMFVGVPSTYEDSARGYVPDNMFELPELGNLYAGSDLNVEQLALCAPDLILDIGQAKGSVSEDMDALQEQTLIPSVFISATLETMPETYRKLGALLGREERGEELAQFCEKIYNRTLDIMEQVGDNRVNCLYVLGQDGLNVIAASSYHAELLDLLTNNLAVVDNPLSKGSGNEVSMDQIALWNPEFVIFGPNSIYSTVTELSPWNEIDAIVNGKYVETPNIPDNWMSMPPSVQRYLGLIWMTYVLYPDYCDYDVKADILEYYELFYGSTLSDEQYDAITANAFLK